MANIKRIHERGNALWFILIAVALLATLTMTISRSGSSVDQSGNVEKLRIEASKILRYTKSVEATVQRLRQSGCSEDDISFWHDSDGDGIEDSSDRYYNDNSPSDHSCHVFDTNGGGLRYTDPNDGWLQGFSSPPQYHGQWFFTGSICVAGVGADLSGACAGVGGGQHELLVYLPYITLNMCRQLNKLSGNPAGLGDPGQDHTAAWAGSFNYFYGLYGSNQRNLGGTNIDGELSGCFEGGGSPAADTYHFYHVLIPR